MGQAAIQPTSPTKDGQHTPVTMLKPELHAEQSRHEMPAEPERFEMSGELDNDEERRKSPDESKIQELRGVEPSGELSTSRFSKTSLQ